MGRLKLCRICLVEHVRMFIVADSHLQEVFQKLTNIPFMTEDSRPMLACSFCYTRLKRCHHFMMKCLEAEEVFAQMLNEDYEKNQLQARVKHQSLGGFVKTQIENIDIIDGEPVTETVWVSVKEELPVDYENDNVDLNEEDVSDGTPVAKKPNHDVQKEKREATISTKQKKTGQVNKSFSEMKEPIISNSISKTKVNNGIIKRETIDIECTTIDINLRNGIHKEDLKCNYIAISSKDIKRHNSRHSNVGVKRKLHRCHICQKNFNQKDNLEMHLRIHAGEKPYQCETCQSSFISKTHLKIHMRTHTGEKPYKCNICHKSFSNPGNLKPHIRTHTGEKPYNCDICQSSFISKTYLKIHMRTHTGEKPYKCEICQRSFNQTGNLKSHMRTHTGEKPHKCDICQSSFNQTSTLKYHMRIHSSEKPYKCEICQRSFNQTGNLKSHMRTHTREKPYKCDKCEKSFIHMGALKYHQMRTHKGEKQNVVDTSQE